MISQAIKILFIIILVFLQANISFAKTKNITGKFVAYESSLAKLCFDFCSTDTIFELANPKDEKDQFIIVRINYSPTESIEKILDNAQKIKIKVTVDKDTTQKQIDELTTFELINNKSSTKIETNVWNLIRGAKNMRLPFGKTLNLYVLAEPTANLLEKLK